MEGQGTKPKRKKPDQKLPQEEPKAKSLAEILYEEALRTEDYGVIKRVLFHKKLRDFQAERPKIERIAKVSTPEGDYYYAPLDYIVNKIAPYLTKNNLTYRWDFEEIDNEIICTCIIGDAETGYETRTSMKAKKDETMRNALHSAGSTMTYLQRYTLKAALGLTDIDSDDDGIRYHQNNSTKEVEEIPEPKIKEGANDNQKS